MSDDIKVSVLTPIYNHKIEYVRQCLDSLHAQTMQDIEFILIDNGATKESKDLISEYEQMDTRFRVIHLKENQGYGGAMNAGLDAARGEYIGIVESDDWVDADMYEILYKAIIDNNADIVKTHYYNFTSEQSNIITRVFPISVNNSILPNEEVFKQILYSASIWTALYKKSILHNVFVNNKSIKFQDILFNAVVYSTYHKIYALDNIFYHYRIDNENSSIHDNNFILNLFKTYEYIYKLKSVDYDSAFMNNFIKRTFNSYFFHSNRLKKTGLICNFRTKLKVANFYRKLLKDNNLNKKVYSKEELELLEPVLIQYIKQFICVKKNNKIKYFGGLIKKKYTTDRKKLYILGVQVYTKKLDKLTSANKFNYNRLRLEMQEELVFNNLILRDHAKFLEYKNIYHDKDVVIVARGPSAAKYTNPLKNAIHIALNKAFKNPDIKFDYIFMHDYCAIKDYILDCINYPCTKFFGRCLYLHFKTTVIPDSTIDKCNANLYYTNAPFETIYKDIDCAPLMDFMSVAFPAIHFALYTGAKRIFLVGCDCSSDGYSDGTKQSAQSLASIEQHHKKMFKGYKLVKEFAMRNYPETEIISINPVNLKGYFKDIYTDGNNQLHLDEYTAEEVYCVN